MIIGITGTDGAGKGEVVDYLKTKGFVHYSARDLIVAEIKKRGLEVHRPQMKLVGNALREEFGGDMLIAKSLLQKETDGSKDCIIESLRTVDEANSLHTKGGVLLAIDADQRLRYERIHGRGSETDNISFKEFVEQDEAESVSDNPAEQNKKAVMQLADHVIMNDGTIEELHAKVETWLQSVQ